MKLAKSNGSKGIKKSHPTKGWIFELQTTRLNYYNDNFHYRIQIKEEGRKRKIIIKDAKVTDAGLYSCVSNADKTEAELVVNCKFSLDDNRVTYSQNSSSSDLNRFNKKLKDTVAIEREKVVLEVELQDTTATAVFLFNGQPIKENERVEIKNLGGGKHQLVFNKLEMTDDGEITCESGNLTSTCKLTVKKGESKPIAEIPDKVEGPCSAPLFFEVPYKSTLLVI